MVFNPRVVRPSDLVIIDLEERTNPNPIIFCEKLFKRYEETVLLHSIEYAVSSFVLMGGCVVVRGRERERERERRLTTIEPSLCENLCVCVCVCVCVIVNEKEIRAYRQ